MAKMEPICIREDAQITLCGKESNKVGSVSHTHYKIQKDHIESLVMCSRCQWMAELKEE